MAALSVAEAFTHAYLTWESERPEMREQQLARFMPESLEDDDGLNPADGSDQAVV